MKIATALTGKDGETGVAEICRALRFSLGGAPDFLAIHHAVGQSAETLRAGLAAVFPEAQLHGGSSCLGVMTEAGLDLTSGLGLGAFAIRDPAGDYGSASADLGEDARSAAAHATATALARAGRPGESPDLVWMTAAPGQEEAVLDGVKSVVGARTLIVGGSAADDTLTGRWSCFGPQTNHRNGVSISVLFPSGQVLSSYLADHAPTTNTGVVTAARGRHLLEIDHRPAAEIYSQWTGLPRPAMHEAPQRILVPSLLHPLGRVAGHLDGTPLHVLAHPSELHPDGTMMVFADLAPGDRLWHMTPGTPTGLPQPQRVIRQARAACESAPLGALVILCAGAVLGNRSAMPGLQASVSLALGPVPFLGLFTYGEQGALPGGVSQHGNLMMSCTLFTAPGGETPQEET
jgi:hypothetical protein